MASSMSPECTALKHEYDNCFNSWFEGYLEPVVSANNGTPTSEERATHVKQKSEEYEASCGKLWESYRDCVQVRHLLLLSIR